MTLSEIISARKKAGYSAIEIQKYLREQKMIVSFTEVKKIFLEV